MGDEREGLRERIEKLCLLEGSFILSTGVPSDFYFDCKNATLNATALSEISDALLKEIRHLPEQPDAIGGLTMGADFITAAVIVASLKDGGKPLNGSIVRKEPKQHGTMNKIENELPKGTKIVVIDDVFTTGKSTIQACDEFKAAGYKIVAILGVIDREAGGIETLKRHAPIVKTLFTKSQFPRLVSAEEGNKRRVAA